MPQLTQVKEEPKNYGVDIDKLVIMIERGEICSSTKSKLNCKATKKRKSTELK